MFKSVVRHTERQTDRHTDDGSTGILKLSHGNLAYVTIMLFINIKLLMIDNYLSKGFPGQLHEALCKCICMIFD